MNFLEMKKRIKVLAYQSNAGISAHNFTVLLGDIINETRDWLANKHPLRFLATKKTLSLTPATYSYAFDKGESTGRYGGYFESVYYDNGSGNTPAQLQYVDSELFNVLYPTPKTQDPKAYTVRGETFTVDAIPSVVTGKSFVSRFYALPDKLTSDTSEGEMDVNYYDAVIYKTCIKLYEEIMADVRPEVLQTKLPIFYNNFKKAYSRLVLTESIYVYPDQRTNTFI